MRAFLNSSEYFNLFFVRTIFAFVRDELRNGRKINFKIIGRPYSSEEIYANLRKELDETLIKFPERELELTLLSTGDSKIIFEHGSKKAELALN